jgi:hypothetical protein
MRTPPIAHLMAELIAATSEALGLLAAAIGRQSNAAQLTEHLRAQIKAHELLNGNPLARRLATGALAALEAESAHQNPPKH